MAKSISDIFKRKKTYEPGTQIRFRDDGKHRVSRPKDRLHKVGKQIKFKKGK